MRGPHWKSVSPWPGFAGGHPEGQKSWWSPDGRMLALESSDGSSLALISVDPTKPGSI
jgi:hypothetical protein